MARLAEDEVYIGAKALLRSHGWTILAGQPPSGSNHLPVVEVKWSGRAGKGSKGAYKPDLIASKAGVFMLVECKPDHNEADAEKLREILGDASRKSLLFREMTQRHLLERHGITSGEIEFCDRLIGAIAHSGAVHSLPDLVVLSIASINAEGRVLPPELCHERVRTVLTSKQGKI